MILGDNDYRSPRHRGLTLLETVIVVAIIAILLALMLPAVQFSRESVRKVHCSSNLRQISIAVQTYEGQHRTFPPGNTAGYSFLVSILPQMDMPSLFNRIDFNKYAYDMDNDVKSYILNSSFPEYRCPSDGVARGRPYCTNYAGNMGYDVLSLGYNGVFDGRNYSSPVLSNRGSTISSAEISDGLSQTALSGEILAGAGPDALKLRTNWATEQSFGIGQHEQFCEACLTQQFHVTELGTVFGDSSRGITWYEGTPGRTLYTHSLPPNNLSCLNGSSVQYGIYTLGSNHNGGAQVVYSDGHVKFIASFIDRKLWRAIGTRAGNEGVSD